MPVYPDQDPADAGVAPAADELAADLESLRAALAETEARAEESRNALLRAVAEMENIRKRAQRDVEAAGRYGAERLAADLLEVADSLDLGIAAGAGTDAARLLEGMEATLRLLARHSSSAGITVIDPQGQPFDPQLHEAMATQESAEAAPGTVLVVVQKGYALNGRLLRPARVIVAREARRKRLNRRGPAPPIAHRIYEPTESQIHGQSHRHRPRHDQFLRRDHGRRQAARHREQRGRPHDAVDRRLHEGRRGARRPVGQAPGRHQPPEHAAMRSSA